jgi:hypothetical protein
VLERGMQTEQDHYEAETSRFDGRGANA